MTIYSDSIESARCKLCGVRILWALTFPNRKKVPLDSPLRTTNIAYDADGHEISNLVSTTHFVTCKQYEANKPVPQIKQQALF